MSRIELPNGQWADLRERLTHAQAKDLRRAWIRAREDPELQIEVQGTYVRAFVRDWKVNDPDGVPILITDGDAIDRAPDDVIDAIFTAAIPTEKAATDPKASTSEPSPTSPVAEA